ncbi:MAG: hypothetical protein M9909_01230 [Thermomicrobiales bacterium]|nr:hypothetical protein [Thermomicrobiales bacterium]
MAHTNVSGVFPHLTVSADAAPRRSETGIGALMPWAGKLWMVSYVAHTHTSGSGTGLFSVDKDMNIEKHAESVVGTYANRMIHAESHQLLIGPHIVDLHGEVRTIKGLVDHRLAAVMPHQEEPETKALYLTMEGLLVEVDLQTLEVTTLFNLLEELEVAPDAYSHFKAGYANDGKIFVTNNTYAERDFSTSQQDGRLAMYDGKSWEIIDRNPIRGGCGSAWTPQQCCLRDRLGSCFGQDDGAGAGYLDDLSPAEGQSHLRSHVYD